MSGKVNKCISAWKRFGEIATGLKYPSNDDILDMKGVLKKTIVDFPLFGLIVLFALFNSVVTKGFSRFELTLLFTAGIMFAIFLKILCVQMLWTVLVWNPRARRLRTKKPSDSISDL